MQRERPKSSLDTICPTVASKRKFVWVCEKDDCCSDGARNPVFTAARSAYPLTGSKRAATLPWAVEPKSL